MKYTVLFLAVLVVSTLAIDQNRSNVQSSSAGAGSKKSPRAAGSEVNTEARAQGAGIQAQSQGKSQLRETRDVRDAEFNTGSSTQSPSRIERATGFEHQSGVSGSQHAGGQGSQIQHKQNSRINREASDTMQAGISSPPPSRLEKASGFGEAANSRVGAEPAQNKEHLRNSREARELEADKAKAGGQGADAHGKINSRITREAEDNLSKKNEEAPKGPSRQERAAANAGFGQQQQGSKTGLSSSSQVNSRIHRETEDQGKGREESNLKTPSRQERAAANVGFGQQQQGSKAGLSSSSQANSRIHRETEDQGKGHEDSNLKTPSRQERNAVSGVEGRNKGTGNSRQQTQDKPSRLERAAGFGAQQGQGQELRQGSQNKENLRESREAGNEKMQSQEASPKAASRLERNSGFENQHHGSSNSNMGHHESGHMPQQHYQHQIHHRAAEEMMGSSTQAPSRLERAAGFDQANQGAANQRTQSKSQGHLRAHREASSEVQGQAFAGSSTQAPSRIERNAALGASGQQQHQNAGHQGSGSQKHQPQH